MIMIEPAVPFVAILICTSEDIKLSMTFNNIASLFYNDKILRDILAKFSYECRVK